MRSLLKRWIVTAYCLGLLDMRQTTALFRRFKLHAE